MTKECEPFPTLWSIFQDNDLTPKADMPWFDPDNGNADAEVLLLLQSPGPKAMQKDMICSLQNDDPTAQNLCSQLRAAGLVEPHRVASKRICLWNTIPWWHEGRILKSHIERARRHHMSLFDLLQPNLKAVVLVGQVAMRNFVYFSGCLPPSITIVGAHHPSALGMKNQAAWAENIAVFTRIAERLK